MCVRLFINPSFQVQHQEILCYDYYFLHTGSGKTTQVPQYILDTYAKERKHCNIICTQPRRIAATSIASFICKERGWQLGNLVGYQIGLNRCLTEDTRLTFVTTGVLLQKLIQMKNMNQYSHVILDEVHERDQDTDFCLLVVRRLLRTNSPHVKVLCIQCMSRIPPCTAHHLITVYQWWLHAQPIVCVNTCMAM